MTRIFMIHYDRRHPRPIAPKVVLSTMWNTDGADCYDKTQMIIMNHKNLRHPRPIAPKEWFCQQCGTQMTLIVMIKRRS